jgi:hypothetical protein
VTSPSPVTLLLSMQDEHRRPARRTTPLRVTATPSPATGLLLPWTSGRSTRGAVPHARLRQRLQSSASAPRGLARLVRSGRVPNTGRGARLLRKATLSTSVAEGAARMGRDTLVAGERHSCTSSRRACVAWLRTRSQPRAKRHSTRAGANTWSGCCLQGATRFTLRSRNGRGVDARWHRSPAVDVDDACGQVGRLLDRHFSTRPAQRCCHRGGECRRPQPSSGCTRPCSAQIRGTLSMSNSIP